MLTSRVIRNQTLRARLTTTPGADITLELCAFRATRALTTAQELSPGVWELSYTVPSQYSNRYFALHVLSRAPEALSYSVSATTLAE